MPKAVRIAVVAVLVGAVAVVLAYKHLGGAGPPPEPAPTDGAGAASRPVGPLPKLVEIGAGGCVPCTQLVPVMQRVRNRYAGRLAVEVIDLNDDPQAKDAFAIRMIPTLIFLAPDGRELDRHEGFLGERQIVDRWKRLGYDLTE